MGNEILEKLDSLTTEKEISNLFKNVRFQNKGNSKFFDNNILLMGSGGVLTNYEIKLKGISSLYIRIMLYLKLNGNLGTIPQGSGEYSYFSNIHSFIYDVIKDNEIDRIDEIDSKMIDRYIVNNVDVKGFLYTPLKGKIERFLLPFYHELELPYFLRINEDILSSPKYKKLIKESIIENRNKINGIGAKKTYPLSDLKIIINKSIEYIELYENECLEMAKLYLTISTYNQEKKYKIIYDKLKKSNYIYKEPLLKETQELIFSSKTLYSHDEEGINLGRSVNGRITSILSRVVEKLEVSCVSIILMMTGMRVGEFTMLDRQLNITQDEHFYLKRIVYKTSETSNGEFLSMPIPNICKKALEILSKLATIKDGKKKGNIILSPIEVKNIKNVRTTRINNLLNRYCAKLGLEEAITPHQFRHAMAFLISHIHESDGLELARMFLGHTSIIMTLQYMAHYNKEIKDAIAELSKDESEQLVEKITEQIQNNNKLFGENGKRLMFNHKFAGQQVDEFIKLMRKGLLDLIEEEKLVIIQTPISLCIHDLSKPENLACQRGFDINEIATSGPSPSRCIGANCSNAIFFEEHILKMKNSMYLDIEPKLRKRLEKNTYFMEAGGFEQDPYQRIIKEYDNYKEGIS